MFFCILAGNAWGKRVYFTYTSVDLSTSSMSTTTDPDNSESCYMYQQDIYWLWYEGANPINLGKVEIDDNITNAQDCGDFEWTVKINGNIDIVCYAKKIDNQHNNDRYFLKHDESGTTWDATKYGSHIYFKSSDGNTMHGTINVTATNKDFDGEPFTCSYTIRVNMDMKSTKWDFYSSCLHPTTESVWIEEIVNGDDKLQAYNVEVNSAKDLGSIITETTGLQFIAPKNSTFFTFGYKDPAPSGTTAIDERYVGLYQGGTLIIPKTTWDSHSDHKTRIRIKMGRFGGTGIRLTIGNGKDALDTPISGTGTYEIGGSMWWGTKGDNHQRGEYHFIVNNKEEDFTLKVESGAGAWLKLYSIEVYESDELITENSVLGDKYQLLNTGGTIGAPGTTGNYYLHYRGKAEGTKIKVDDISTSGNITTNDTKKGFNNLEASSSEELGSPKHQYTSKVGDFGTFGITIGCYTHGVAVDDVTYKYCTDYASRRQSVGYMENKSYPYTWDFKDIFPYKYAVSGASSRMEHAGNGEGALKDRGLHLWAITEGSAPDFTKAGLRLALDAGHNVMYCGGSQLWYGETIIPEAAGLAFTPVNYDNAYDYSLSLSADGLTFAQENRDWWGWRVTVPSVPAGGAVYIHATKDRSDSFYGVKYYVGASVNNKTNMPLFAAGDVTGTDLKLANQIGGSSDGDNVVYAVCNQGGSAQDITLFFNGVTVHKMAVSTAPKTVNKYGWATESRNQDIDPELTSYMTGQNFTNYIVTAADYAAKHVTMTPIANTNVIRAATVDDSQDAYIIHNNAGTTVNIVNGGFHLFAPDMHESDDVSGEEEEEVRRKPYVDTSSNFLRAKLYATDLNDATTWIPATSTSSEGKYTNYAFTWRNWMLNADGEAYGDMIDGPQAFYRIAAQGAQSTGNQAYLPVLSERAAGARGFYMVFGEDEDPGSHGTAVEVVKNTVTKSDVYYNLNGQQLTGKPVKGGIYIHNGKKVVIK